MALACGSSRSVASLPGFEQGEWWVLHGDPDWSDANPGADPKQVADDLVQALRQSGDIPNSPDDVRVDHWLNARPKGETRSGHLWFPAEQIAIAGDWLDGGRVEGAFNSADGLASRLISLG